MIAYSSISIGGGYNKMQWRRETAMDAVKVAGSRKSRIGAQKK